MAVPGAKGPPTGLTTGRRKLPALALVALLAAVVAACGFGLWRSTLPRYLVIKSRPLGPARTAVAVTYPADWLALTDDETADSPVVSSIVLRRRWSTGLQRWIEVYLDHANHRDWNNAQIQVQLQAIPDRGAVQLDREAEHLQFMARQLVGRGGTYAIHKSTGPAGAILDLRIDFRQKTTRDRTEHLIIIYPGAKPGRQQYEVVVRYNVAPGVDGRLSRIADDVVSRLKLVQDGEGSSP